MLVRRTVLVVALALTAALVVAPQAGAADGPHLVYLDTASGRVVTSLLGAPSPTPDALSPSGVLAQSPVVSADGAVVAYGVRTGARDDARTTWGLYVSHAGTTRIVTDVWDTAPAIDGAGDVWWVARGDLWRYSPATATTVRFCTACIATTSGTSVVGLAVDPGAAQVAVALSSVPAGTAELRLYSTAGARLTLLADLTGAGQQYRHPAFDAGGTELALTTFPVSGGTVGTTSTIGHVVLSGPSSGWAVAATSITGYLPRYLDGAWYVFSDGPSSTTVVSTTADLAVAPVQSGTIGHWDTTTGFTVAAAAPATATAPAPLPATASLQAPASSTGRVQLYGFRTCSATPCDTEYVNVTGVLLRSTDRRTWTTVATTNPWPYTLTLTRTTSYIWSAAATATLAAATSPIRTVVYLPTFTAGALTSTSVSGRFSRKKGSVVLQVRKKKVWRDTSATATMTKKGRFSLTYAFKKHKKYALRTVADARAGVAYSGWFRAPRG